MPLFWHHFLKQAVILLIYVELFKVTTDTCDVALEILNVQLQFFSVIIKWTIITCGILKNNMTDVKFSVY